MRSRSWITLLVLVRQRFSFLLHLLALVIHIDELDNRIGCIAAALTRPRQWRLDVFFLEGSRSGTLRPLATTDAFWKVMDLYSIGRREETRHTSRRLADALYR